MRSWGQKRALSRCLGCWYSDSVQLLHLLARCLEYSVEAFEAQLCKYFSNTSLPLAEGSRLRWLVVGLLQALKDSYHGGMNLGQRDPDYLHLCFTTEPVAVQVQSLLCRFFWVFPFSVWGYRIVSLSANEDQTRVSESFPTECKQDQLIKRTVQTQLQEPGYLEVL